MQRGGIFIVASLDLRNQRGLHRNTWADSLAGLFIAFKKKHPD